MKIKKQKLKAKQMGTIIYDAEKNIICDGNIMVSASLVEFSDAPIIQAAIYSGISFQTTNTSFDSMSLEDLKTTQIPNLSGLIPEGGDEITDSYLEEHFKTTKGSARLFLSETEKSYTHIAKNYYDLFTKALGVLKYYQRPSGTKANLNTVRIENFDGEFIGVVMPVQMRDSLAFNLVKDNKTTDELVRA